MEFNKEKIMQPNTVIWLRTEEQDMLMRKWADSEGLTWCDKRTYIDNGEWYTYKDYTCMDFYSGEFCTYSYYNDEGYNILKFEDVN